MGAPSPRPLAPGEARDLALAAAREAAALLRSGWGHVAEVRAKAVPTDLVTEWDTRSERLITERLLAAAPGIPILGEEGGAAGVASGATGERWLVDPIDGTVNFAHGVPLFAVSIGYERAGALEAGAVVAPALGWEFAAALGEGATMNGESIRVSGVASLERALLSTGFPYDRRTSPDNNFAEFERLQRAAGAVRRFGSASLDLCMVARGWEDGYWESRLQAWDLAAGVAIVREAGGRVSARDGGPFRLEAGEIVASNGRLHDALVRELGRSR